MSGRVPLLRTTPGLGVAGTVTVKLPSTQGSYISVTVRASMGGSTADNRQPYRTAVTQPPPPPPPSAPAPAPAPSGGVACRAGDTGDDCQTGWCKAGACGESTTFLFLTSTGESFTLQVPERASDRL